MTAPLRTQRILVLDDDEVMRGLLEMMLSREEFEVTLAHGGEDALRLLGSGVALDVVLSDINMPGLHGRALAEGLRANVSGSMVLVGMSASEPPAEVREAFDGFLLKPFSVQLLRDAINTSKARKNAVLGAVNAASQALPLAPAEALDDATFSSLLRMIAPAQLGELFRMALKDIEKRHGRILEAVRRDDLETAQQEAHAIKGSCGMIGATELQSLAAAIEIAKPVNLSAVEAIPAACLRLQRVLESKL